jgi:light-regulated signal transduction histidine kinase (bacteriophytochrome)
MENLLGNAWKFTQKQAEAKIEFGKTEKEGKTIYFIRDNGVGFDMKYANKLFIPFQRLHSDSEFAGTGVGLTLVQRIVRRHGGDIWVESAVEKGATFYFTLER